MPEILTEKLNHDEGNSCNLGCPVGLVFICPILTLSGLIARADNIYLYLLVYLPLIVLRWFVAFDVHFAVESRKLWAYKSQSGFHCSCYSIVFLLTNEYGIDFKPFERVHLKNKDWKIKVIKGRWNDVYLNIFSSQNMCKHYTQEMMTSSHLLNIYHNYVFLNVAFCLHNTGTWVQRHTWWWVTAHWQAVLSARGNLQVAKV